MPAAKYFRIIPLSTGKTKFEVSAIHLYNDNTRVDQTATLSSGFGLIGADLNPVKSDTPAEGTKIDIDLATKRQASVYIIWTFAANVNVNAFRIGSGTDETTFLDKFVLQYSDDGITFKSFVRISVDKKLYYPGPWQLSELKPVGEGYPMVMSKVDQMSGFPNGFDCGLRDNYSFKGNVNGDPKRSTNWTSSSTYLQVQLPGFYKTGKYYFEVSCAAKNLYSLNNAYNKLILGFFKDDTERLEEFRLTTLQGGALCINHPACVSKSNTTPLSWIYNTDYSVDVKYQEFTPGVQHGLAIDFDSRSFQVVNPTYAKKAPGVYPLTNSNFDTATTPADKLSLALVFPISYGSTIVNDDISINFGQRPFTNTPPPGFQAAFGPRWHEIPDTIYIREQIYESFNRSVSADYITAGDKFESPISLLSDIMVNTFEGGGRYYIKGTVTRQPASDNKRFLTLLFSHNSNSIVRECVVSGQGLYEFFGIEYGLYTVLSVDLRTGITSEAIGPVYPKEII